MVRNQDGASFLSWESTLHPESAASVVNSTALQNRHPLEVMYHEISSDDAFFDCLPVAVQVVAVHEDEDEGEDNHDVEGGHHAPSSRLPQSPPDLQQQQNQNQVGTAVYRPKPWQHSNTIDLVLGFVFAFVAWITTMKIEFTAFIVYAMAAFFHFLGEDVFGRNSALLLIKSICIMISAAFMIADSILLMVNVLITEILGGVALLLCTLFGGQRSGVEWHQFIRRTCHLTRWGFRSCLTTGWKPERIFPIPENVESASLRPSSSPNAPVPASNTPTAHARYSDNQCHQEQQYHNENPNGDDGSMSTLTATTLPAELPTVTVAAESVHVLNGHGTVDDDDSDGFFTKNTQHVIID
mmetsp:Transcript_14068/g.22631  ORF Transcript_14068/g.22631 Transcript_14068/m.22631 type:complete len:354 (-) Transcript_14068:105-1166(-)